MGADADILNMWSVAARWLLIVATNVFTMFFIIYHVLEKRRSFKWLCVYAVVRVLLVNILIGRIWLFYYADNAAVQTVSMGVICVFGILNYVVLYYSFEGGLLKILIVADIAELAAVLWSYIIITIFNLLEGRSQLWEQPVELHWMDAGIPIVQIGLLLLGSCFLKSSYEKIKKCKFTNRKILWLFAIGYPAIGIIAFFIDARENALGAGIGLTILFCGGTVIIVSLIVRKYKTRVGQEKRFLDMQCRLIATHYEAIQRQIYNMEKSQDIIDGQMQEIIQMERGAANNEKIKSYLNALQQRYKEIHAGMYSDDWMLDSAVYMQEKIAKGQGIRMESSIQNYAAGRIEKQDIVQIVMLILDFGIQANEELEEKWMKFSIAAVKNQLIIELKSGCSVKSRLFKGMLKEYLKKYQGEMKVKRAGNTVNCTLVLQMG